MLTGTGALVVLAVAGAAFGLTRGRDSGPAPAAAPGASGAASSQASTEPSPEPSDPSSHSASPSPEATTTAPSPATSAPAPAAPAPKPTTPLTLAAAPPTVRAHALLVAFERLYAGAGGAALVATAPFGDGQASTPVRVVGAPLPGALDAALRAGKITASGVPDAPVAAGVPTGPGAGGARPTLLSPAATLAQLSATGGPSCSSCAPIALTAPVATRISLDTVDGEIAAPAWSFAVAGSKSRVVVSAIAARSWIQVAPPVRPAAPAALDASQLPLWQVRVARGDHTITADIDREAIRATPGCWRLLAEESAHAVVLTATRAKADATGDCAPPTGHVAVTLPRPVGERALLDTYWQRALAY